MAIPKRLAILRARHDANVATIPDSACVELMIDGPGRRSVLNFWEDNTYGGFDFSGSRIFPWVDIELDAEDSRREAQIRRAYDATVALVPDGDLAGYDGYVVLTHPGEVTAPNPLAGQPGQAATVIQGLDGGATAAPNDKPACALPVRHSTHTFMCHEVGHVLGFGHTYGVWNNGVDWDGGAPWSQSQVYGDPYDIMSAASFGTRRDTALPQYRSNPTFPGPSPAGWPIQPTLRMGPAPARAVVHMAMPGEVPAARVRVWPYPDQRSKRVTLHGSQRPGSPHLHVFRPPDEDPLGRGRCYIELRENLGWDQGLDVDGADLARRAVVIHTIADADGGTHVWYRGRILLPIEVDSDLAVKGTPLHVRVQSWNPDEGVAEIEVSNTIGRGAQIDAESQYSVAGPGGPIVDRSTPCGDMLQWGRWLTTTATTFRVIAFGVGGHGEPTESVGVSWTVAGVPVTGSTTLIAANTPSGSVTIACRLDPATRALTLQSAAAQHYSVPVQVRVTEPDGSAPVTASASFAAQGSFEGYRDDDVVKLATCTRHILQRVRIRHQDVVIPRPGPIEGPLRDRINAMRLNVLANRSARRYPREAAALKAVALLLDTPRH